MSPPPVPPPVRLATLVDTAPVSPPMSMVPSFVNSARDGSVMFMSQITRTRSSIMAAVTTKVTVEPVGVHVSVKSAGPSTERVLPSAPERICARDVEQSSSIPGPGVSVMVTVVPRSAAVKIRVSIPEVISLPAAVGVASVKENFRFPLGIPALGPISTVPVKVWEPVTKFRSFVASGVAAFESILASMKAVPQTLFLPSTKEVRVKVKTSLLAVATATMLPAPSVKLKVRLFGTVSSGGRVRVKKSPPDDPSGTHQSISKSTDPPKRFCSVVVVTVMSLMASVISAASAGTARNVTTRMVETARAIMPFQVVRTNIICGLRLEVEKFL